MILAARRAEFEYFQKGRVLTGDRFIPTPDAVIKVMLAAALELVEVAPTPVASRRKMAAPVPKPVAPPTPKAPDPEPEAIRDANANTVDRPGQQATAAAVVTYVGRQSDMVEYTKTPQGQCGWIVQADHKKGGDINPTGPQYFATEAEADKWIAEHKKRHGAVDDQ